jgi:hypothetical protein
MHATSEQVLDLIDGTVHSDERPLWEVHLLSCPQCADEFAKWYDLVGMVKHPHLTAAPADTVVSAKKLFRERSLAIRPSLRHIVAAVIFDSFSQPALAGVRTGLAIDEQVMMRQVMLQAQEFDIHIRISRFEDHCDLLGQILPRGSREFMRDANLYLRHGEDRISSANVNELGEFQFSGLPNGMLSLQIDLPTLTVISALNTEEQPRQ